MFWRQFEDLLVAHHFPHRKMLFLAGPRQVGKTTLARNFLEKRRQSHLYYNWDDADQRRRFLKDPYAFEKDIAISSKMPLIVFDEIHKYPRWKNYLKGAFDRYKDRIDFMVTGSGRLNIYKKGSDSLLGRYFMYTLLPLTAAEILGHPVTKPAKIFQEFPEPSKKIRDAFDRLMHFSGFPEPLLKGEETFLLRWEANRKDLILHQDIRDLTNIREIGLIEHLMLLLPGKIGSPLSLNSLCEDLQVSFKTVQNWMGILERVYYLFSVTPYSKKIKRALKKERKVYLWNWRDVAEEGARFENVIACHLQKLVSTINDFGLGRLNLHYCRDRTGREVDFLLLKDEKPWALVEVKMTDQTPAPALIAFMKALGLKECFQVIAAPGIHFKKTYQEGVVTVISAEIFLAGLV